MCPACIVAAALIGVKATSTGGLMAFIVTKFGPKNVADQVCTQTKSRGDARPIPDRQCRQSDPFERLPNLAQREQHSYGGTVQ
jgi:hypothetical protein